MVSTYLNKLNKTTFDACFSAHKLLLIIRGAAKGLYAHLRKSPFDQNFASNGMAWKSENYAFDVIWPKKSIETTFEQIGR